MSTELTGIQSTAISPELAVTAARAEEFQAASRAPGTMTGYRADWRRFLAWIELHVGAEVDTHDDRDGGAGAPVHPVDPAAVSLHITELAERLKAGSIARAIKHAHALREQELL